MENIALPCIGSTGQQRKPMSNNYLAHLLSEHETHDLTVSYCPDGTRQLQCKTCNTIVIDSSECDLMATTET